MCEIDEGRPPIQLPNELLYMITKPMEDADRIALALSGTFDGFASFFNTKWNKKEITVSFKYHFLTGPVSWDRYLNHHLYFPLNITTFNANNCYWISPTILSQVITKMKNLEELCVKDTQISFPHLARVFGTCKKITKLDFSYREKNWEDVKKGLSEENMVSIAEGFKKLTGLQITTCSLDARDYLNDPWLLIMRILSWCRDCTDLTVEVTYSGRDQDSSGDREEDVALSSAVKDIKNLVENDFFEKMDWVFNLRSLILTKFGVFTNAPPGHKNLVRSLLLNQLLGLIFSEGRKPVSLRRLWIQNFSATGAEINSWSPSLPMTAHVLDEEETNGIEIDWFVDNTPDERFKHLEHFAVIPIGDPFTNHPRGFPHPNLKYVRATCQNDDGCRQMLDEFLFTHPTLEFLHVDFYERSHYVPSILESAMKLSKLRVLVYDIQSTQNHRHVVEALANYCPNLEVLRLNYRTVKDDQLLDVGFLSLLRFPKLSTLTLRGRIQMNDGSCLVQMVHNCSKLKHLKIMSGTFDPATFFPNFDQFLKSAVKLRDLGFGLDMNADGKHFLTIFKSILKFSPDLERLFLVDVDLCFGGPAWKQPDNMESTIMEFALEMKHLVALVLGFPNNFPSSRMNHIRSLMVDKVSPLRPVLWYWFDLDRIIPNLVDPTVPFIHYQEMIEPFYYPPPL